MALPVSDTNQTPFIAPGPRENIDESIQKQGGGAESFRPSEDEVWTETSRLESLNSLIGFRPAYPGAVWRFLDEGLTEKRAMEFGEARISPEEANKLYPHMPVPFSEPILPSVAAIRAETARRQNEMRAWIDRGPTLSPYSEFTAQSTAALDPGNLALGLLFGGSTLLAKMGGNIAGNLIADIPTHLLKAREQQSVNIADQLSGSVASGVAGTLGFEALGKSIGLGLRGGAAAAKAVLPDSVHAKAVSVGLKATNAMAKLNGLPTAVKERLFKSAITQHELGAHIDMKPMEKLLDERAKGGTAPNTEPAPYAFTAMEHPSDRVMFAANQKNPEAPGVTHSLGDQEFDGMRVLSDRQSIADNHASGLDGKGDGAVTTHLVEADANLVDLDKPLPERLLNQAEAELRKAGIDESLLSKAALAEMTGRHVMELIRGLEPDPASVPAFEVFKARAENEGYDGFKYVNEVEGGATDNRIALFNSDKLTLQDEAAPARGAVPEMSPEEKSAASDRATSPEMSRDLDPKVAEAIEQKLKADESIASEKTILQEEEQAIRTILERPDQSPELAAAVADHLSAIDEEYASAVRTKGWVEVLADCFYKGFT